MMSKYMQVIWLYLIGIAVIFVGLIMLSSNAGPTSFIFMLMGLAIAAMGAAHGRRMRMLGQLDIEQLMREKGMQEQEAREGPAPQEEGPEEVELNAAGPQPDDQDYVPPQRPINLGIGSRIGKVIDTFRSGPSQAPLEPEDIYNLEMEDIKKGKIAATTADVIMLVCPKCGAENEEKNVFCYDCGNQLKKKTDIGQIRVEPGAITVIDDKRVAKVVICPKCNLANKVGDKFCRDCGKKILADDSPLRKLATKPQKARKAEKKEPKEAKPKKAASGKPPAKMTELSELEALFAVDKAKKKAKPARKARAKGKAI